MSLMLRKDVQWMGKKRYRIKALPVTLLLALVMLGCISIVISATNRIVLPETLPTEGDAVSQPVSEPEEPEEPAYPEPVSVRLIGVGDNLIHPAIYQQAAKRTNNEGFDFAYAYNNVRGLLAQADITSINQETVMAEGKPLSGYPQFNSPQELGLYLTETLGFDVVNMANNHCLDMGADGLTSTLDFWDTQTPARTGVYRDEADAEQLRLAERDGVVFAFLGMTESLNGLSLPADSPLIIVSTRDEERIERMIRQAKAEADVVVVNAHWGTEYTTDVGEAQTALAEKMINWGADIILGHHPHVIQPVKYITRHDGTRGVVAYSLGNFISAQDTGWRMLGGALDVTVTKSFETDTIELSRVRFIPLVTHYEGNCTNVRVYPLADYTEEMAQSHGVRSGKTPGFSVEWLNQSVSGVIDEQFLLP